MIVVVASDSHKNHCPKYEFELGKFLPWKEHPKRLENILQAVKEIPTSVFRTLVDHGLDPILKIHSPDYIDHLKHGYQRWLREGGSLEGIMPDVFAVRDFGNKHRNVKPNQNVLGAAGYYCFDYCGIIVDGTYQAAYDACQVVLTAADILVGESQKAVFALMRPPGHHAHQDLCGGYCYFNNASVVAAYLRDELQVGKVAILDVDYHHGNGTQTAFYSESNPLYVSLHGTPDYPYYWGFEEETGEGSGKGFNINIPLPPGTQDNEYLAALNKAITQIASYNPDVLVVSLGLDTFKLDPVGHFFLTTHCYREIGLCIAKLGNPTLFVMEGGYCVEWLGRNCANGMNLKE